MAHFPLSFPIHHFLVDVVWYWMVQHPLGGTHSSPLNEPSVWKWIMWVLFPLSLHFEGHVTLQVHHLLVYIFPQFNPKIYSSHLFHWVFQPWRNFYVISSLLFALLYSWQYENQYLLVGLKTSTRSSIKISTSKGKYGRFMAKCAHIICIFRAGKVSVYYEPFLCM